MMKFYSGPGQQPFYEHQPQPHFPQEMMNRVRVQSNSAGKHSQSSNTYQLGHHYQQFEHHTPQYYNQFAANLGVAYHE